MEARIAIQKTKWAINPMHAAIRSRVKTHLISTAHVVLKKLSSGELFLQDCEQYFY
jgi:hypothetical protein